MILWMFHHLTRALIACCCCFGTHVTAGFAERPNIVFVFTDDQDLHHGSLDHMPALQEHLVKQGTSFTNHYATVAVCCPSRVSLMRGQAAHNTSKYPRSCLSDASADLTRQADITNVAPAGGGYGKWLASGEDDNYLPHWLRDAGYQSEYIGKLYNGHSALNYSPAPKGWDHIDILLDPYTNAHNSVVMSQNGARPMYYEGFQQSDIVRIKAIERLQQLTARKDHDPFFLMIAPTAPHVQPGAQPPAPPSRYIDRYANLTLPFRPNFNPSDQHHENRPAWWAGLPRLNQTQLEEVDLLYRRRSESLLGVDDIVEDVVDFLKSKGELDNTYIIFSSDQGYHLGTHRDIGKCSPYLEDTNIPLVVRGPDIPKNYTSRVRSTVIDFAPTFLDIAGTPNAKHPPMFDGSSMLAAWKGSTDAAFGDANEAINVEFWGRAYTELPTWTGGDGAPRVYKNNTYKTMRIVGEEYGWVYSRWCTGSTELYDTTTDPFEMTNLAGSSDPRISRVTSRLNALLMAMKSCEADTCRDPWSVLQPPPQLYDDSGERPLNRAKAINSFADALAPGYDDFFAGIPAATIAECEQYQFAPNERPFFPPEAEEGLGLEHRASPAFFEYPDVKPLAKVPCIVGGGWDQRTATFEMLMAAARPLADDELAQDWDHTTCNEGQRCTVDPRTLLNSAPDGVKVAHTEL